jgi:phosphoglycerate dehydrogenase-like enzyme
MSATALTEGLANLATASRARRVPAPRAVWKVAGGDALGDIDEKAERAGRVDPERPLRVVSSPMPLLLMLPPQTAITRQWAARLAAAVPELSVRAPEDLEQAARAVGDAAAAFGTIPPDLLRQASRLRWLQAPQAAPPAGYYYPELVAHPVVVTNFREIYNDHIGAHIMAFVLAFARGLHRYLPQQLRREWRPAPLDTGVVHLPEATALVVGVGGIGAEAARLAAAFGMRVIGVDARRREAPPGVAELHHPAELDSLLPQGDFVILTVPHTPATEGFMNRARFQRMKRTAFFVNIGRGMTTRLDDLVAALRAGEIAGAGLDVFEQEPLPADHPLWTMPGVLITPHTAGYGPYLDDRRFEILLDNCRRFLAGQPLRNVVDKTSWF